ncbi:MAG: IS5 family transposase [Thermoplasmata archaeon]
MIENYTPMVNIENRDKRIWSKYNESLVKRAVMLIDTDVFERWNKYLEIENSGKIGRPYEYPIEFFEFLMKIRALWNVPFRVLESFVRILSKITGKFRPLTYVAIFKRIRKIDVKKMMDEISRSNMNKENMYIIIDSTGFRITDRGEWMNEKYSRKRKGWIKVHLAIDADSFNVVSLSITDEKVHDSKEFKKLIDPVLEKTKAVYGDKGYDSKEKYC